MIDIENKNQLDALVSFMNENREAKGVLMATLLKAQELYGYISEDMIRTIDRVLGVPASRVDNIVHFYSFFNTTPVDYVEATENYELKQEKRYKSADISVDGKNPGILDTYTDLDTYVAGGGLQGLVSALSSLNTTVIQLIKDSGYKGRGDGGYVAGLKLEQVANVDDPNKGVICNADSLSRALDYKIIKENPFKLIEAMIIAGHCIGSANGYIYTQDVKDMEKAVKDAYQAGLLGDSVLGKDFAFNIEVRYSADQFISPREVETNEYIERDLNIHRDKKVVDRSFGIYGKPREYYISEKCIGCTKCAKNCPVSCIASAPKVRHIIDSAKCVRCGMCMSVCPVAAIIFTNYVANVETLINLPDIILKGAEAYKEAGNPKNPGMKIISIEGDVNKPGLVEVPTDALLGNIIADYAGGSLGEIKGVRVGGPIGPILTKEALEKQIDFEAPLKYGLITGVMEGISLYVIADQTSILDIALKSVEYSVKESCGKCTPCREGTKRTEEALNSLSINREDALNKLENLAEIMSTASLCSLGQLAPTTITSILANYRDEL